MNFSEVPSLCRGGILSYIFSDNQSLMLASLMLLLVLAESKGTWCSFFRRIVNTTSLCTFLTVCLHVCRSGLSAGWIDRFSSNRNNDAEGDCTYKFLSNYYCVTIASLLAIYNERSVQVCTTSWILTTFSFGLNWSFSLKHKL